MRKNSKFEKLLKEATDIIVAEDCKMISELDTSSIEISDNLKARVKAYIDKMRRKAIRERRMHRSFLVAAFIIALLPVVLISYLSLGKAPVTPAVTVEQTVLETEPPETNAPETEAPPYDDIDSPLYEPRSDNYSDVLNEYYFIYRLSKGDLLDYSDLRDAAEATWNYTYGEQLPFVYAGLKWYIAKYESITKEEFWEAVKDTDLTEEQVDVMFTFDDDLVMQKLHNRRSFYFKGKLYSADYMSEISNRGTDQSDHSETLIGAMKRSSELEEYISEVLKIDKKFGEQLKAYFDGLQVGQPTSLGDYLVSHLEVGSPDAYESVFSYIAKAHGYTEKEIQYLNYRFTGNIDDPYVKSEAKPDNESPRLHQYLIWYNSAVHKVTKEEFKAACEKFNSNVLYDWERITDVQIDAMFAAIDKRNDQKVIESFYSPLALKHEGTFRRLEEFAVLCKQNSIAAQYKGNEDIKRCLEIAKNYTFNEKTEYIEILQAVYETGTPEIDAPETEPPKVPLTEEELKRGTAEEGNYRGELENCAYLDPIIKSHGYDTNEIANRFMGWNGYEAEWEYSDQLPGIYQYIKWYSSNFHTISKEEFWALEYVQKNLTEEEVTIMFTFDDELVKEKLHALDSFYFEGTLYSLDLLYTIERSYHPYDYVSKETLMRMRDSDALHNYLSVLERIPGNTYNPDLYVSYADGIREFFNKLPTLFYYETLYDSDGYLNEAGEALYENQTFKNNTIYPHIIMDIVSELQGYSEDEITVFHLRYYGSSESYEDWDPERVEDPTLPELYLYFKWYAKNIKSVTKAELTAANDAIKDDYPLYSLSDEEIDALLSLDDDQARAAFLLPTVFVYDGELYTLYGLTYTISDIKGYDLLQQIKGSAELEEYIKRFNEIKFKPEVKEKYRKALTEAYSDVEEIPKETVDKAIADAVELLKNHNSDGARELLDAVKFSITYDYSYVSELVEMGVDTGARVLAEYLTANIDSDTVIKDAMDMANSGDHSTAHTLLDAISNRFTGNELMSKAKALIAEKKYNEAYVFLSVVYNVESSEMMKDFTPFKMTESDSLSHYKYTYNERGQIVRIQRAWLNDNPTDYYDYYVYTYNDKGQLIAEYNDHDDNGPTNYEYIYDSDGKLVKRISTCINVSRYDTESTFEYDDKGRLVKETAKRINATNISTTEYEYNYASLVTTKTHTLCLSADASEDPLADYEMIITTYTYEYDSDGNMLKEVCVINYYATDSNWNIIEETLEPYTHSNFYEFNENGLLIKESRHNGETEIIYEYNGINQLISESKTQINHYTVDEFGNQIPVIYHYTTSYTYNELGLLTLQEMGRDTGDPYSFSYHYDCFGNLLTKMGHYSYAPNSLLSDFTYSYIIPQ